MIQCYLRLFDKPASEGSSDADDEFSTFRSTECHTATLRALVLTSGLA